MADGLLVSIVTPTMNREALLEGTLSSVAAQTHTTLEHIVVDGGSTDGTVELLAARAAADPRLRWTSEPDRGMYDAINKGLRDTRGEIVAYVNSDDRYFPWSVATAVRALDETGADLVFGDVMRSDELRGILAPVFQPPLHASRMAAYGTLFQPTVFMRRRVLDELGGFDDSLRYVADLEFWLRAAERFRIAQVSEFLALEYRHEEMLSETARDAMAAEDVRTRDRFRRGLWANGVAPLVGKAEWHAWSAIRWLGFVRAAHGAGPGWERTIAACRPRITASAGSLGVLPSKGSSLRARTTWGVDPRTVAEGATAAAGVRR